MSFKKHISMPDMSGVQGDWQKMEQLLGASRAGLEQSAQQQNLIEPSQYANAGLEATYSGEDTTAREQQLLSQQDAIRQAQTENVGKGKAGRQAFVAALQKAGVDLGPKPGKNLKGKLKSYLQKSGKEASDLAASGRRLTGVKESQQLQDQRGREQDLLKTEQQDLSKSLSMNAEDVLAADPALKQELEAEQAKLEQSQVNQFGSLAGAQGGTVGAVQNAAMGQARASAIADSRRQNIGLYQGLQTQQAGQNQQLSAGRQALAAEPGAARAATSQSFGNLANAYGGVTGSRQSTAQMEFQRNAFNQTQPGIGESILKGIGGLLMPFKQQG